MESYKDRIMNVFTHILNNDINQLDEMSKRVLLKSFLVYKKQHNECYSLSSNGKLLRRLLAVDKTFQKELLIACDCSGFNERNYEECLTGAIHFAATYIRCR
ncbi:MAG: hypothetical protein WC313_12625 [Candidatus Kapaibacterium sp.]|jgi:hypothetical protein|nr:hypothetical protein [Candidatus Kapabacteria bacterium]